jgi:hypothetical protein
MIRLGFAVLLYAGLVFYFARITQAIIAGDFPVWEVSAGLALIVVAGIGKRHIRRTS